MAFQEVETTGYGTRVGRSFKGIGGGFVLLIAATVLLWWNEGRAVKTDKMLNDAEKVCIPMENPGKADASLDGELVCATAMATTEDSLSDSRFAVGAKAISLQRDVKYYQWVEHSSKKSEDKVGGKEVTTTTYTYSKEWTSKPVPSESFKDPAYQGKNGVLTTVEPEVHWAENVNFGAYKLNEHLIRRISSKEPMNLSIGEGQLQELNQNAKVAYERFHKPEEPVVAKADTTVVSDSLKAVADSIRAATVNQMKNAENKVALEYVHQAGNMLYFGRVPGSPEVGDVIVTWEKVVPAKVTLISQVDGDTFKPYKAKNGKRFETLVMGKKDAEDIFESEHSANSTWLWILRILGILLVIAALKAIFNFLETLLKVVPFLSNILGWGVGVVCTVVGLVWSLLVIALAWLFYRPIVGIALLAVAAVLIGVFCFRGKGKNQSLTAE